MIGTTNFKVPQTMFFLGGGEEEGEERGREKGREKEKRNGGFLK